MLVRDKQEGQVQERRLGKEAGPGPTGPNRPRQVVKLLLQGQCKTIVHFE